MTLNRWLSPISSDKNPLFNGMFLIPIILTVTLAFEGVTQEDSSPIVSKTYAESEQASEDEELSIQDLYQSYRLSIGAKPSNPYPYIDPYVAGNEGGESGDSNINTNVYYGDDAFGAGNCGGSATNNCVQNRNTGVGYQIFYETGEGLSLIHI